MSSSESESSVNSLSESCSETDSFSIESDSNEEIQYDEELEPIATAEEIQVYEERVAVEAARILELQRRFQGEISVNSWCTCSCCSVDQVTKPEECSCCREIDCCQDKLAKPLHNDKVGAKEVSCVTMHPGFRSVCLDRWVLEIAAIGLKTRKNRRYTVLHEKGLATESQFFRSVSYRQFFRFVWGYTGCSKRLPLPSCVYHAIRTEFPSDSGYHGFEDDDDE